MENDLEKAVLRWLCAGEVGLSSKALAAAIVGAPSGVDHPHDPDDFRRCVLFLRAVPAARDCLAVAARLSPYWAALVPRWNEVEALLAEEMSKGDLARKTFDLMDAIYAPVRAKYRTPKGYIEIPASEYHTDR